MQPIFSRLLNLETRIGMIIDRTDYLQKIVKKGVDQVEIEQIVRPVYNFKSC